MGRVVLVTGVCRELGGRFARKIAADPSVDRVVGVDVVPPRHDLGDVHFVRADIRNAVIAKVMAAEDIDTVVHLGVIATPHSAGGRSSMQEINVIGTMQLLAACQQTSGLERLVVKSSARVYGASPNDPAMFSEEMAPKRLPTSGFGKDSVEVEGYVRGFARRRSGVEVTMLRMANLIGPTISTSLTRFLRLPVIPTVLGYDPRLQFCHEDDALAALQQATTGDVSGTFNIAGDGIVMLSQIIRQLGRPSLSLPSVAWGPLGSVVSKLRRVDLSSEERPFLTYGRGLDTTAMREVFGFQPAYTTPEALATFVERAAAGPLNPDRLSAAEDTLTNLIRRTVPHGGR